MNHIKLLISLLIFGCVISFSSFAQAKQIYIITQAMHNLLEPISRDDQPKVYQKYCNKGRGITTLPNVTFQSNYPKVPRSSNTTYWDKKFDYFIQYPGHTQCRVWKRK